MGLFNLFQSGTLKQVISFDNPGDMWGGLKTLSKGGYNLISSNITGKAGNNIGEFEMAHVIAKPTEDIQWGKVTKVINGVKHKKISVAFESHNFFHAEKKLEAQQRAIASVKQTSDKNAETIKPRARHDESLLVFKRS